MIIQRLKQFESINPNTLIFAFHKISRMIKRITIIAILASLFNCQSGPGSETGSYLKEHRQWQEKRISNLTSESGWLNLAGLFWLGEGLNTIGSDKSNTIIFPGSAPPFIGSLQLEGEQIFFVSHEDCQVFVGDGGEAVTKIEMMVDRTGNPTLLKTGSYGWFIIQRGERYAIRLRDYKHPDLEAFHGIESFPADPDWRVQAEFIEFSEPMTLSIPNVLGTMDEGVCPGALEFTLDGETHHLFPTETGSVFFVIFADQTSGAETYGAGRFLSVEKPDAEGRLHIDFNRAYNPPCAYTEFATCPLPPSENILKTRITAGEMFAGH